MLDPDVPSVKLTVSGWQPDVTLGRKMTCGFSRIVTSLYTVSLQNLSLVPINETAYVLGTSYKWYGSSMFDAESSPKFQM